MIVARLQLASRQAVRTIGCLAHQGFQIDMAAQVLDQAVFQTVFASQASKQRVNHRVFFGWNISGRIFKGFCREPQRPRVAPDVRGVAGNDAVELAGISKSLQQASRPPPENPPNRNSVHRAHRKA